MGNEATKIEPVVDFESLLPGQTVVMKNDKTDVRIVSSIEDDSFLKLISIKDGTEALVEQSDLDVAEKPREPYESKYEEAAVAWLKMRVRELIKEYEVSSVEEYKRNGPSSPRQRRGSRKKSGINLVGAKLSDAGKRTKIMIKSSEFESLYLGFLSMLLPKQLEARLDIDTWKSTDLEKISARIHESLVWRFERQAHELLEYVLWSFDYYGTSVYIPLYPPPPPLPSLPRSLHT